MIKAEGLTFTSGSGMSLALWRQEGLLGDELVMNDWGSVGAYCRSIGPHCRKTFYSKLLWSSNGLKMTVSIILVSIMYLM